MIYIAECAEVGTVEQGETIEQAIAGLQEATRLYLKEIYRCQNTLAEYAFKC